MIKTELRRGSKIYWKRGESFTVAYFMRIHDMPSYKALTIKHASGEIIIKDDEAFTERERFECEYHDEILALRDKENNETKASVARFLEVPYSRILRVSARCNALRIPL